MGKEDCRNIEEAILQKVETIKRTVKQGKPKKLNYLKYKPVNENIIWPNETVVQQVNSKLSYANALKRNIYHKPPTNNTTARTSGRPTLQQQLKSFSTKHTRRNRSRSPSRQQSTANTNDQLRDQKNSKLKNQNKNTKQVTTDHTHKHSRKIQTERKV